MRKILYLLGMMLLPSLVYAQGYHYQDVVLINQGGYAKPAPGLITVCLSTATINPSTKICSPTATIYSDVTLLTPKTNPFKADANGNFDFYVAQNTYLYTVTGINAAAQSHIITAPCTKDSSTNGCTSTNGGIGPHGAPGDVQTNDGGGNFAGGTQLSSLIESGASGNLLSFPSVTQSDTFNRANGGLGANWTTITGFGAPQISSNTVIAPTNANYGAYYTAASFLPLQSCQISVVYPAGFGFCTILGTGNNFYAAEFDSNDGIFIDKWTAGVRSRVAGPAVGPSPPSPSTLRLTSSNVSGSSVTLTLTLNDAVYLTYTDTSSPFATGSAGILVTHSGVTGIDNFIATGAVSTFTTDSSIPAANVSLNPAQADAVQYVSVTGNDSNSGFSWGAAKQTVMAAYDALPSNGGTIYFGDMVHATATPGQGVWICGVLDAGCTTPPPTGWHKQKPVSFIGIGGQQHGFAHAGPQAEIQGGSDADNWHSGIWLAGTTSTFSFQNVALPQELGVAVTIGCNIAHACSSNVSGAQNITFTNSYAGSSQIQGQGPTVRIGSNVFWVWFNGGSYQGNAAEQISVTSLVRASEVTTVTTSSAFTVTVGEGVNIMQSTDDSFNGSYRVKAVTNSTHFTIDNPGPDVTVMSGTVFTDRGIPIVIDPFAEQAGACADCTGSGLIFVNDTINSLGGVKLWTGGNGGGMYVNNMTVEGDFVHIVAPGAWFSGADNGLIGAVNNVEMADAVGTTYCAEIDGSVSLYTFISDRIKINSCYPAIKGPSSSVGLPAETTTVFSPLRQGQAGIYKGYLVGTTDTARRLFGPVSVDKVNIIGTTNIDPGTWTGGTITTGITDPAGGTNAVQVAATSTAITVPVNATPQVGRTYLFGAWVRSQTANGYVNSVGLTFSTNAGGLGTANRCNNSSSAQVNVTERIKGDGQWDFFAGICTLTTIAADIGGQLSFGADGSHTIQIYGPIVKEYNAGDISLNDAFERLAVLASYSPSCIVGQLCMVTGPLTVSYVQLLAFDFATNVATGDGAYYFTVPTGFNGKSLISVSGSVIKVGTTNTTDIQLAKCSVVATGDQCSGTVVDMLSTKLTIDSNENKSSTAATPAVINVANATLATDQQIRVDVDAVSTTPPKGLVITLGIQ